uniref:Divinyl chlorophyllide a 8-vinyl-reductase, chloroplastic n=1 Tax=Chromera velia CCMP2878 TaxID=1169474 RepID=A0A0G4GPL5_9ALVE|eukprot:Cvel_22799.t1-p1 / transcript=Cvel_22799.t1 / gene=Cvel_22799 / organism=Chromera_velia_CCMP2878 / gene_product=Divinyl chlorophyllide a 8-vinyl-reductase,, putative / transcript_product=Divinyl chlorophyllide a 8-vinyl-reductase,, putative / location=Cvel_scaffold2281:16630-19388(-) / protein_length=413 / sequence_SO=supercontig / SO=protein_coding / is_pseudo=false
MWNVCVLLFVLLGETGVRAFTLFPAPSPFKRPALRRHAVSSLRAEQQLDTAAVREAVQRTASLPFDDPSKVRVVVAGATGYIGKFVVREFVNQGFQTVAFVRPGATVREDLFEGAEIRHGQATDLDDIRQNAFGDEQVDVVVSCLASRSGTKSDSWAVDYQATKNMLDVAVEKGAKHFILLSAFCVNIPKLQFQHAKLKVEADIRKATEEGKLTHAIARPTAFFKSLSGQLETVQQGWPFIAFTIGGERVCKCNPISEPDLAAFMVECARNPSKWNRAIPVGGPGPALSMEDQGRLMYEATGKGEPAYWKFPIEIFDPIIGAFDWMGQFFPQMEDAAELARIGKYYGEYDMLTGPDVKGAEGEIWGEDLLGDHYKKIAVEGQEYDPYTTMFGGGKKEKSQAEEGKERETVGAA